MRIIGLTGGIGSGKSTVASMFRDLGVPVYNSDLRAKELMTESAELRAAVIDLLGPQAYAGSKLNRSYISQKVFNDRDLLEKLNQLVHPAVRKDAGMWARAQQNVPYVLQEAAILIENGSYKDFYAIILVTAPIDTKLERLLKRDGSKQEEILERMKNQWSDAEKIPFADFVIENNELETTRRKVLEIHRKLLEN
ncbi:dephospho-CoA kinase [Zeaxanthinibacter enoshimensis]|uniref:Dephospho-CoA kinase n=1 Tax=Zeaxanthinibacter enoshimensis TaxID=392009 RepID=A0A4R6TQE9_9FLAO|nr:dephospho-CoA kinase [Zeaxanthinibacter enoshimensis]TDQ31621.1 dephospho-CoA kinase [Zeaxanthinibacter enoshimensis]